VGPVADSPPCPRVSRATLSATWVTFWAAEGPACDNGAASPQPPAPNGWSSDVQTKTATVDGTPIRWLEQATGTPVAWCTASRPRPPCGGTSCRCCRPAGARVRDDRLRRQHPGREGPRHLGRRPGRSADRLDRAPRPRAGDPGGTRPGRWRRAHRRGQPAGPVRRTDDHERCRLRLLADPAPPSRRSRSRSTPGPTTSTAAVRRWPARSARSTCRTRSRCRTGPDLPTVARELLSR